MERNDFRERRMRNITYSEAVREALVEEMTKDPNLFLIGEDIGWRGGVFKATKDLYHMFPNRVMDTPISESAIAGVAYGAAITGSKVCAEIMYMDFSFLAMDQIINSAAKSRYMFGGQAKVPVVYRMPCGSGRQQAAQHSQNLEVLYAHIPGLKVIMPSTPYDAKGLLKSALNDYNPIVFVEHKALYFVEGEVPEGEYYIPIGVADIKKSGTDITVIATSSMVPRALTAAEAMEKGGVSVEVIDPRTIRPLDKEAILESLQKTGRLVIVHEAPTTYGMGAEIAALAVREGFDFLDAPVIRIGGKECPIPYNRTLEANAIPTEKDIRDGIEKILSS